MKSQNLTITVSIQNKWPWLLLFNRKRAINFPIGVEKSERTCTWKDRKSCFGFSHDETTAARSGILFSSATYKFKVQLRLISHCQKLGTRWRLRVRTKATMAANSYKKMYGDKETFSNISIMSSRVFGARLETC